jgi:superfamily I DNA and/or RNA helicase
MLITQYRMHEAIQAFPNARFYDGRLEAAPANRRHLLAELDGVELAEPWTSEPVVFYDTSGAGFDEEKGAAGESIRNPREADLAARVVRDVIGAGVPARAIGVISPYAAQVAALRERLAAEVGGGLEVATADGFQGREREAIVISLVRSNGEGEIGFLADHRRANVALTRARRGLFVIGDGATLGGDAFYAALIEHCEKTGALRSAWELM